MKDNSLIIEYVLKQLEEKQFIEIPAISIDCLLDVEHDVIEMYPKVWIWVEQVEDNLYSLFILL